MNDMAEGIRRLPESRGVADLELLRTLPRVLALDGDQRMEDELGRDGAESGSAQGLSLGDAPQGGGLLGTLLAMESVEDLGLGHALSGLVGAIEDTSQDELVFRLDDVSGDFVLPQPLADF